MVWTNTPLRTGLNIPYVLKQVIHYLLAISWGLQGILQKPSVCGYNVITEGIMRTELVRIGNSRGVRIPKPFIEQCKLGEAVDLRIENDCIVISSERRPRHGWHEAFRAAGSSANDELLLERVEPNRFDHKEWKW